MVPGSLALFPSPAIPAARARWQRRLASARQARGRVPQPGPFFPPSPAIPAARARWQRRRLVSARQARGRVPQPNPLFPSRARHPGRPHPCQQVCGGKGPSGRTKATPFDPSIKKDPQGAWPPGPLPCSLRTPTWPPAPTGWCGRAWPGRG